MKKIGLVVLSVLMVLLVSGCGAKTQKLSCKTQVEGVDITFNVGFKGNMIETMDFNYFYDLSKYTDAQVESIEKQDFCQTIKDSMPDYKDGFKSCEDHVNK